jgi:hypothetical protein
MAKILKHNVKVRMNL